MRDPFSWSLPLGRVFGITVRMHLLFVFFILGMWLRAATNDQLPEGSGTAMLVLLCFVFISVLFHEFGHCYAARSVDGDATEVLLWPLGGLAKCDVPHTPRANFITAAGGPAVNLLFCVVSGSILAAYHLVPPFNPLPYNAWTIFMFNWSDQAWYASHFASMIDLKALGLSASLQFSELQYWQYLLGQFFWVNWFLFLLNVVLCGFPLDGGRMLQAALWPRAGYRQSMQTAIFVGFLVMFVVGIYGLVINEVLWILLAAFIYFGCKSEWVMLEHGAEDSLFGYDFSQGYTSLEQQDPPRPRRKRQNFIQRWIQKRAQKKLQREMERATQEERRMDELLEKIQQEGVESLSEEENRFLKRVSDRYRNRP